MGQFNYVRKARHPGLPGDTPYELEPFAEKFGLTVRAAEVILLANGPSKVACDAAARAFNEAVAARHKQWQRD